MSKTFSFSNEKFDEFVKDIVDLQKSFQELIEKEKFFNENNIVKKHFRLSLDNVIRICFGEIPIISQRTINSDQYTLNYYRLKRLGYDAFILLPLHDYIQHRYRNLSQIPKQIKYIIF